MMKRHIELALKGLIMLLAVMLASCSGMRKNSQQELLKNELSKWESFDSQGVVELSVMGLSQRKMFSAAKNHGEIRIDILDGGVMGAGAQPLISFYSGKYLAFKSPYLPMLEAFDLSSMIPVSGLNLFSSADSLIARHGAEIIKTKKLEIDSIRINFNKKYQLTEVNDPRNNSQLTATYSPRGDLQELNFKGPESLAIKLIFDSISYTEPEITPLPKSKGSNLLQGLIPLNEIDLKKLIKDFLNGQ